MRRGVLSVLVLAACACEARAGATNPSAEHGLVIVTSTFAGARHYRDSAGRALHAPGYGKFEAAVHLEYGLTDWLAAIARPRLVDTRLAAPLSGHASGLGVTELGAQAQVLRSERFAIAVQGLARIPGGARARLYDRAGGAEARLLAAANFPLAERPAFLEGQVAWRRRDNGRLDEALIDVTLGWRPSAPLLLMLQGFTTIETRGGRHAHFTKAQASAVYDLTAQWALSLAAYATVHAHRAPRERGVALGVWRRF